MLKVLIRSFLLAFTFTIINGNVIVAQTSDPVEIAEEYLNQGEVEKAREQYDKLAKNPRYIPRIHEKYLNLLITSQDYKTADKYLKKLTKENPEQLVYRIDYAVYYRSKGDDQSASNYIDDIIESVATQAANESKTNPVRFLASLLFNKNFNDKAIEVYQVARTKMGRESMFSLDLANIYRVMNKKQSMVTEYLAFAKDQPRNISYIKNAMQRVLTEPEDLDSLEITLYSYIQNETNPVFNELLIWTHLQQKNFSAALRQASALDRRLENNADNVMQVGIIAYNNEDYRTAQRAFAIVKRDFAQAPNVRTAAKYALLAEEEVLKSTYPVDTAAVTKLISKYQQFMSEGRDIYTNLEAQRRVALLQAFQLNDINGAIVTLDSLLSQPIGKHKIIAEAKMDLADIYLLDKQPWESILLYGQVERMFKDQPLGYSAKLKAAKLSYFKGEFELAKSNLDILKLATSREIANDALDLSILIKNNTVFDSTELAMRSFANMELLLFQNQKEAALVAIDSMLVQFTNHSLQDELLYKKAETLRELGRFEDALVPLATINQTYYYEILGDDALFLTGLILEEDLSRKEEAMNIYSDLLKKFPGSIYVAESRARFRNLRGDYSN